MTNAQSERERIWIALSHLFLDTDVSLHFDYVERTLATSSFPMDEIDLILRDEVTPVCIPNLYDVAGEWAGFNEDWLLSNIRRHLARPAWRWRLGRRTRAHQLRQMVTEWPALRARIAAKRSA